MTLRVCVPGEVGGSWTLKSRKKPPALTAVLGQVETRLLSRYTLVVWLTFWIGANSLPMMLK